MSGDPPKGTWSSIWRKITGLGRALLGYPQGVGAIRLYPAIVVMGIVLLFLSSKAVHNGWAENRRSVSLVREIDTSCQGFPAASGVLCSSEHDEMAGGLGPSTSRAWDEWSPCQMLWISRLEASRSLPAAAKALEQAVGCRRQALVSAWAGELAWLQNDRQSAKLRWQKLNDAELVEWGYALLLDGEVEQGEFLLNLAIERVQPEYSSGVPLEQDQGGLSRTASAATYGAALVNLGHAHRLSGDWASAVEFYEAARSLAPEDMELRFFLGMSYRQTGQPERAIAVLQEGLAALGAGSPEFASDYFVQLGLAHRESGDQGHAVEALQQAQVWLQRSRTPRPEQERFIEGLQEPSPESTDATP